MRIARVDGLRGIAIALVIAFHALHFTFGWIGVDLFFVLSGYLVTSILRRDRDNPVYWKPFYIKRATRILPPFLVALLLCAIFYRQEWHELRFYYLFTLANFGLVPYEGGKAFGALWSLSVEEHFYLLWPLAIRNLSSKALVRVLLCVLLIEPIARGVVTPFTHTYWITYALTPFRLDGLAAGALLAIVLESPEQWSPQKWLGVWSKRVGIGVLVIIVALALTHHFDSKTNTVFFNTFGYSLAALGSVSLLAYTLLHERSWLSSVLENRALVFLGMISYGLYLFHPFIFSRFGILAEHYGWHHHAVLFPIALPVSLLVCWLSFHFFEARLIALGHRWARAVRSKGAQLSPPPPHLPLSTVEPSVVEIGTE